jgi:hypothetical protein
MIAERLRSTASAVLAWIRAMSAGQFRIAVVAVCGIAVLGAVLVRDRQNRKRFDARIGEARTTASAEIASLKSELTAARAASAKLTDPAKAAQEAPPRLVTLSITDKRRELARKALPAFDPQAEVEVPFTRFTTANHTARFLIKPAALTSTLDIAGHAKVGFPRQGVPLKMVELAPGRFAVFFRETFSGRLYLYRDLYRIGKTIEKEIRIRGPVDAEPILREAIVHNGRLLAILYDNERMVNEVVALDPDATADAVTPTAIATLPTLEDPAGTHYEMMPTLFMLPHGEQLWIVGGTLVSRLGEKDLAETHRLKECVRAQEAVAGEQGPVVLCLAKTAERAPFLLSQWQRGGMAGASAPLDSKTIPHRLRIERGQAAYDLAKSTADLERLMRFDLEHNQLSGVMELGTNNYEGRIAWSKVYFLNGLLDLVRMAQTDNDAFDRIGSLLADAKRRLDIEMHLLDRLNSSEVGYITKAFTVKREPALFAVQTGRLLLLFNRYQREIQHGTVITSAGRLQQDVFTFKVHIDQLRLAGPEPGGARQGRHYLAWPKGSAFFFDGLNVPYNHQNEWAYAVFDTLKGVAKLDPVQMRAREQATQIINQFLDDVTPEGEFPRSGEWPYWWGKAKQGWAESEGVSTHMKSYAGDKSVAFISFRSIDSMSTLAAERASWRASSQSLVESIHRAVAKGHVYPFVASSFVDRGYRPALEPAVSLGYLRMTAPWELQGAVWALLDAPLAPAPEDPHSHNLNAQVMAQLPGVREAKPSAADARDMLARYFEIAIPFNVELAWRHAGLELGGKVLACNLAYDLDAAVAAYERTGDIRFSTALEQGLDAAMAMRDDRLGKVDEIRKRVMPAWGTNRYSPDKKQWMAWDAFIGIIAHPAIVHAHLVMQRSNEPARKDKAQRYLRDATEAVAAFDDWWREDIEAGMGWYLDPLYQDVAPLNHMNLLGMAHVELCKLFARQDSCTKAAGLARFFQHHLKRNSDGTCAWEYWAGGQLKKHLSTSGEDITHAHINVRFAVLAWKHGIVIEKADIECITRALTQRVCRPTGDWGMAVDGTGDLIKSKLHEGLSAWGELADIDPNIPERIEAFMLANPEAYPLGLLSYATGPASFARRLPTTK